jgi:hypothetical protein
VNRPTPLGFTEEEDPIPKASEMAIRHNTTGRWAVTLYAGGKHHHLGTFESRLDAQDHYDHCLLLSKAGVLEFPRHPRCHTRDPSRSKHAARLAEVVSQYSAGRSLKGISESTGVPVMSLYGLLKKAGVEIRARGWRRRDTATRNQNPATA